MKRGGHNRKITAATRKKILRTHLLDGAEAGSALAASHGLSPNYARKLASERGYRPLLIPAGSTRVRELAS
jgi:hypothetical protein